MPVVKVYLIKIGTPWVAHSTFFKGRTAKPDFIMEKIPIHIGPNWIFVPINGHGSGRSAIGYP